MVEDEDVFKHSANAPDKFEENVAVIRKEIEDRNARVAAVAEKLKDPIYVGGMISALKDERENTNRILKSIYAEIERMKSLGEGLDGRMSRLEELVGKAAMPAVASEMMLPKVDEQIVAFIKKKEKACAEDVQREFKYRGKNAASARLNRLYDGGVLNKQQAGRTVWYFLRK